MALEQLKQEFEHLLETGDNSEIRQFLDDQNISDIANLVYEFPEHDSRIIAGMTIHRAAGVFKILEFSTQQSIIQ
ncbi:MAG: magnesium transporter, partial [Bacteroidota bacterium]|nr:magnesium transporter [Bacteroidota bacterium]